MGGLPRASLGGVEMRRAGATSEFDREVLWGKTGGKIGETPQRQTKIGSQSLKLPGSAILSITYHSGRRLLVGTISYKYDAIIDPYHHLRLRAPSTYSQYPVQRHPTYLYTLDSSLVATFHRHPYHCHAHTWLIRDSQTDVRL